MVIVIASSFRSDDPQTQCVINHLSSLGISSFLINPLHLDKQKIFLEQRDAGVELVIEGSTVKPSTIYMSRLWRTDCILDHSRIHKYPGMHRLRIQQFMQDIRFSFECECNWLPGKLEDIERADSKPRLYREARSAGLNVPTFTVDSFEPPQGLQMVYRKNLGYPFTISFSRSSGNEVGITACNEAVRLPCINDSQPWQWQEPIEAIAQIRCFAVGEHMWSRIWFKKSSVEQFTDFRFLNQIKQGDGISWHDYRLPKETANATFQLMKKLGIEICAPEFLLRENGQELVLIDLNPCGDWYGFFNDSTNTEISRSISNLILKRQTPLH